MTRMAGWLIVLMFAACTNRTKVPEGIIEQKRMEKIMWDMLQADRYVSSFILNQPNDSPDVKNEKAALFYEKVFSLNKISKEEFLKSYKFYLGRPDITKTMFDSISARADRQRDQMYRQSPRSVLQSKRDSLLRADSLRRADSIEKIDLAKPSTEELFADSVLKE
ncbi:MAG: DUF4296 domain-containing protein [Chitinophagaceae bacterium]|nr:DUF4296 domain-containing protein [Chitinophagaceae bacterium]